MLEEVEPPSDDVAVLYLNTTASAVGNIMYILYYIIKTFAFPSRCRDSRGISCLPLCLYDKSVVGHAQKGSVTGLDMSCMPSRGLLMPKP